METISRCVLTFLLNSLWQVPLVALVAVLACRIMRHGPASHRHAVWVAALVAAVLLPLASMRTGGQSTPVRFEVAYQPETTTSPAVAGPSAPDTRPAPSTARDVSLAQTTATALLGGYLLFVLFRLSRFAGAWIHTSRIRQGSETRTAPPQVSRVWARCLEAFGLSGVELRSSPNVSGPVAAGAWSGTIVLPDALFTEASEEVLTTAIGHEMAHIARHDFGLNVVCEILYLPLSFHPAAWWIRRAIEQTREMACDELVTRRLMDPRVYARSIMSIAAGMAGLPRPGYTLGVFDGNILEERIRRLVERPVANLKRARLLLATGFAALGLCAVLASGLALTARAQSASRGEMTLGVDAYNRNDYKAAIGHFRNAVALEPSGIRPKLFLANALIAEFNEFDLQNTALMTDARQQYLNVLALDPQQKPAVQGVTMVAIYLKQFSEAHDWVLKQIQLDPRDAGAYYTAGFLDWSIAYPLYARTRQAAGMRMEDPGIIPDAGLRQNLRSQISPQLDEGFRMLQVALQLDPDYSDAMAYINLLYRIKSAIVDSSSESKDLVAQADDWVRQALEAKRRPAQNRRTAAPAKTQLDVDGPPPGAGLVQMKLSAPPPPPPPPPPPGYSKEQGDQPVASAPMPGPVVHRAEGAYWQVAGNTAMSVNTLVQILTNGGFRAFPAANSQDGLVRVMVGPYSDSQALEQARAEIEKAGFRPLRIWGTPR